MIWNKAWKVTFSPPASEIIYCNSNYDLEWRTARFILVWKTTRVMHVHATWSGPQKIPSNNMISIFANFHHSQKRKVSLSLFKSPIRTIYKTQHSTLNSIELLVNRVRDTSMHFLSLSKSFNPKFMIQVCIVKSSELERNGIGNLEPILFFFWWCTS